MGQSTTFSKFCHEIKKFERGGNGQEFHGLLDQFWSCLNPSCAGFNMATTGGVNMVIKWVNSATDS